MKADGSCQGIGGVVFTVLVCLLVQVCPSHAILSPDSDEATPSSRLLPSWLEIMGSLEIETTRQQNLNLTPSSHDTRTLIRPELQLETHIEFSEHINGVLLLELSREFELQDDPNQEKPEELAFGIREAYVQIDWIFGRHWSLQIGRLNFEDERQWLYDNELDGIRMTYTTERLYIEAFVARQGIVKKEFINSTAKEDTDYYQLLGHYYFGPLLTLTAHILRQDDNRSMGDRPWFFGIRASGELFDRLRYWLDAAHVRGENDDLDIRGWGVDAGVQYRFDLPLTPSVIVGIAFGSGDKTPESATDTNFRQTGVQGNGAEFDSITEIQYYGELLDPELSNLLIVTAGLGLRPIEDVSLTVMYHVYRLHRHSDSFRDAALDVELTGESRDVGSELDVMGVWAIGKLELKFVFGAFFPGDAFLSDADTAFFSQFRLQVKF